MGSCSVMLFESPIELCNDSRVPDNNILWKGGGQFLSCVINRSQKIVKKNVGFYSVIYLSFFSKGKERREERKFVIEKKGEMCVRSFNVPLK